MSGVADDFSAVIEAYRNAPRSPQAKLVIPQWMARYLNAMPVAQREGTLREIDRIASSFGLDTPTLIEVCE